MYEGLTAVLDGATRHVRDSHEFIHHRFDLISFAPVCPLTSARKVG